jgi:hypothetical protein
VFARDRAASYGDDVTRNLHRQKFNATIAGRRCHQFNIRSASIKAERIRTSRFLR